MASTCDTPAPPAARLIGGLLMVLVLGAQLAWADSRSASPVRGVAASESSSVRSLGERVVRVLRVLIERPAVVAQSPCPPPPAPMGSGVAASPAPREVVPGARLLPWLMDLPPPAC